jgi:8-hydroxy-5-deazaflavin:NADPH oxidoreductase
MAEVTIIGAGNMARGIATRLLAGGAQVQILSPDARDAASLAGELAERGGGSVSGAGVEQPPTGEVVVLATPYEGALEIADARAEELAGKVVVDITNPLDWSSFDRLVTPPDSSAAEEIAGRLPGARVVKAFNTTFAGTLVEGEVDGIPLDVLLAGDDEGAKTEVASLVEAGGMRAVDAGPLRRARQLEHLGFLHMALQDTLGAGGGSAVKFVTP